MTLKLLFVTAALLLISRLPASYQQGSTTAALGGTSIPPPPTFPSSTSNTLSVPGNPPTAAAPTTATNSLPAPTFPGNSPTTAVLAGATVPVVNPPSAAAGSAYTCPKPTDHAKCDQYVNDYWTNAIGKAPTDTKLQKAACYELHVKKATDGVFVHEYCCNAIMKKCPDTMMNIPVTPRAGSSGSSVTCPLPDDNENCNTYIDAYFNNVFKTADPPADHKLRPLACKELINTQNGIVPLNCCNIMKKKCGEFMK